MERGSGRADRGDQEHDEGSGASDEFLRDLAHLPDIAARSPEEALEGTLVHHFRIVKKLGRGGMGIVYLADDEKLKRQVALKLLLRDRVGDDDRRRRLLREARAASAITHPNIAAVYEVGEDGDRVYIAMELVRGQNLRERLARGRIPHDEATRVGVTIARALAKAHELGIVHRDLKPDNVMIDPDGHVKLLDFGLAKLARREEDAASAGPEESASVLTTDGRILGTPSYMSPEQASGRPTDARSDVFSLGVVLYEMLCGARPFAGTTSMDVLVAINRDDAEPLATRTPSVPADVARIVMRCLEKSPDARYADCCALAASLEAALMANPPRRRAWLLPAVVAVAVAGVVAWRTLLAPPTPAPGAAPALSAAILPTATTTTTWVPPPTPTPTSSASPSAHARIASPPPAATKTPATRPTPSSGGLDPLADQK